VNLLVGIRFPGLTPFPLNTSMTGIIHVGVAPGAIWHFPVGSRDIGPPIELDPALSLPNLIFSNNNLTVSSHLISSPNNFSARGTNSTIIALNALKYWEGHLDVSAGPNLAEAIGVCSLDDTFLNNDWVGLSVTSTGYQNGGAVNRAAFPQEICATFGQGDIIRMAAWGGNAIWVAVNGGLWNNDPAADPVANVNGIDISFLGVQFPAFTCTQVDNGLGPNNPYTTWTANFVGPFTYSIPSGYSHF
jgi:hypothetical protein